MEFGYLFYGNLAVWLGLCAYLAWLGAKAAMIEKRLARMEILTGGGNER